jgi:probable F420-dependent oxidoreductase
MDFGVVMFAAQSALLPAAAAQAIEERGFESLFYPEHTHIPVDSRRADNRPTRGYAETYDPFVALAAAAAVTSTLRLGTAVCLVAQHDPITTAKAVASLDQLSAGRFLFGVGAGWNRAEMINHGTDPRTRMHVFAERLQAMRAIWTDDEAEYHGEYVDFGPMWSWPKPHQRPHPPILMGGNGPGTEDRVLALGDGWLPQCGPLESVEELAQRIASLQRRAQERGRDRIPVTLFGALPESDYLEQFADAGVDRCLFTPSDTNADELLATLDRLAELAGQHAT